MRLLLLLLASSPFSFASSSSPSWRASAREAQRLYALGKDDEALKQADAALAAAQETLAPDSPEIAQLLGQIVRISLDARDDSRLPAIEKRLEGSKRKTFDSWLALSRIYDISYRRAQADAALDRALALKPGDPEALLEKGVGYERLGECEKAIPVFKKALSRDPAQFWGWVSLGSCYSNQGRFQLAQKAFSHAKRDDSRRAEAYIMDGYFSLAESTAAAGSQFQSLVAMDTANPVGYLHMGAYLRLTGKDREAEAEYHKALKLFKAAAHPDVPKMLEVYAAMGDMLLRQGRLSEARTYVEEGLSWSRKDLNLLRILSQILAAQGHVSRAQAAIEESARLCEADRFQCPLCPTDTADQRTIVLSSLAAFYADHGKGPQALALADATLAACPAEPRTSVEGLKDVAWARVYRKLGRGDKARALSEKALAVAERRRDAGLKAAAEDELAGR